MHLSSLLLDLCGEHFSLKKSQRLQRQGMTLVDRATNASSKVLALFATGGAGSVRSCSKMPEFDSRDRLKC